MSTSLKQILFVGESLTTHSRIQAQLARLHPAWQPNFVRTGAEARAVLTKIRFDAVVADESLPDMDGFALLQHAQNLNPEMPRVIICELSHPKAALKITRAAHHCVPKPWEIETICTVLERAFSLGIWLSNARVRSLVQRMSVLPSPPNLYFEIVRALRSDTVDLQHLASRAAQDPALTAKLLQIVNSATLGLRHRVTSVQDAIGYLGLETTKSLVLLAHTFSYGDRTTAAEFSLDQLWAHSLKVATLARRLANEEQVSSELADEAFLAGLLHEIGKLLLVVNMPDEYRRVLERARASGTPLSHAELEELGATHGEVGAELMAVWNLPLRVVEALALYQRPAKFFTPDFSPLTAVHVADALAESNSQGHSMEPDLLYLREIGLENRLENWRGACLEEMELVDK